MVKYYESISDDHQAWIMAQAVFFVASAPTVGRHINVSPKGLPVNSLAILGPNQAAYLDATGSGNETISHVRENGRITVMFCSFGPVPRIMRLFCTGSVVEHSDPAFRSWLETMGLRDSYLRAARAVITLDVFQVQTSCGYGVPLLGLADGQPALLDRDTLVSWGEKRHGTQKLLDERGVWNSESLDGLPGLRSAMLHRGRSQLAVALAIFACRHRRLLELLAAAVTAAVTSVLALWLAGRLAL